MAMNRKLLPALSHTRENRSHCTRFTPRVTDTVLTCDRLVACHLMRIHLIALVSLFRVFIGPDEWWPGWNHTCSYQWPADVQEQNTFKQQIIISIC